MTDVLDVSQYDLPAGALIDDVDPDTAVGAQSNLLARLRRRREANHAALEEWSSRFDGLYDEAVRRDFDSAFLIRWAAALLGRERAALERLYPVMETLQQKIAEYGDAIDEEALEVLRDAVTSAFDWVTPYQTLCTRLLNLASERRFAADGILRARPVGGEVDHEALSREFIARFPKIRAALAE
jgi:hypothetical protein